jgi:MFS family permease
MAILLQKNAAGPPERAGASAMGLILILLGGLHYGYNIGIVGASLDVISDEFPQTERVLLSLLSSATLVGAIVGSPLSGLCADRFGRRLCTIIGESLSVLGSLGCLVGESLSALVACRLVVGVGVGFCTLAKPIYVAETVPTRSASVVLGSFPVAVTLGILAAHSIPAAVPWRSRFGAGALPAGALLLIAIGVMRESEFWLAGRTERAAASAARERDALLASAPAPPPPPRATRGGGARATASAAQLFSAVMLAAGNQLTGAFPMIIYTDALLADAGAAAQHAAALGVSAANVLSAVLAVALLPRFARSTLLVVGNALSCAAALALALGLYEMARAAVGADGAGDESAHLPPSRWRALSVGACCAKTIFHQIGPGAVYFVAVTELGPPEVTTPIYSLGNTAKYAFECITSFTVLSLRASVGNVPLVVFFAGVNALCAAHGVWVSRVGLLR